ncbi:MAG TPA: hypothetical protein GXZ30_15305 [Propionibacterium sp.]|nr:hypothetical protein [Propionibacterium sp.]
MMLRGLAAIAADHPDRLRLDVAVTRADELFSALERSPVDLVLLDLHLADDSAAADTVTRLTALGVPCLLYTSELRPVPIRRALAAGARGLALKADSPATLLDAIDLAVAGEAAVSSELADLLARDKTLAAHLSQRELETLKLLASGIPRKAVGHRMEPPVAEATVNTYLLRATKRYAELGRSVSTATELIREAIRDGHLDP